MSLRALGLTIGVLLLTPACAGPALQPWHTAKLSDEFSARRAKEIDSFEAYQRLEDRLFAQLERKVYAHVPTGPKYDLVRYSAGSAADPRQHHPDWNRSFERVPADPVGGALLLHGMSDSPYSLRALAEALTERDYRVIGLRLPGHGTAPSGLRFLAAEDMIAAVRLAVAHLAAGLEGKPIHLIGYSTGAALALDYALDAADGEVSPQPASLVLISPAIRIHPGAALARFKNGLSVVPGLARLAYTQILPEFDPFRYGSFATNAGDVVHRLTRSVDRRVARIGADPGVQLPPILVFKSSVDATVTTEAVVDHLLARLAPRRHELVLFDINRFAATSKLLVEDPAPLTNRLLEDGELPFGVTFVTNESPESTRVVVLRKPPLAPPEEPEPIDLAWPPGVLSLSHVAVSFSPDDPLYGRRPPENREVLFLGEMSLRGERGLLVLPPAWLLRMRYNPFYPLVEQGVLDWFQRNR